MKKYYFNDGPSQPGSSVPEEPKEKNTKAATAANSSKKSTAWISYLLALLVVGAVGYLVYQDMEKNKGNSTDRSQTVLLTDSTSNSAMQKTTEEPSSTASSASNDTVGTELTTEPAITTTTTTPVTTEPATVTTTGTTTVTPATTDAATIKAQKVAAQKLAQKKAEENKKKLLAAQAAAALKEKEYRNNWRKYISVGRLDYTTKGDGINAFNVPVTNSTNAILDNVTLRVEYMKKGKKIVNKETVVISNIAPGATSYGKAAGYKKGDEISVIVTNISSRKLHFCYPANNGNPADPYFCN